MLRKGLLLDLRRKARKDRKRPALVVQVLDQSQMLQNPRERERLKGREVVEAKESVSTTVKRQLEDKLS